MLHRLVEGPAVSVGPSAEPPLLGKLLHDRLQGCAHPVVMSSTTTVPGATVWTSARVLVGHLRERGLAAGDLVLVRTDDPVLLTTALVAGLSGRFVVCLRPAPSADDAGRPARPDDAGARLVLVDRRSAPDARPPYVAPFGLDGLDPATGVPRPDDGARDPGPTAVLVRSNDRWAPCAATDLAAEAVRRAAERFGGRWDPADRACRPAGVAALTPDPTTADGVVELLVGLLAAEVLVLDAGAGGTTTGDRA